MDFWQAEMILSCRPNKDEGKKNEERTGVKKKGMNIVKLDRMYGVKAQNTNKIYKW